MMKYLKAEAEIIEFDNSDVVTASGDMLQDCTGPTSNIECHGTHYMYDEVRICFLGQGESACHYTTTRLCLDLSSDY